MSDIMLATCPECKREIKLNKVNQNGFCMHCGAKLETKSVLEESGYVDMDYINTIINECDTAYKAGNYSKAIEMADVVLIEDQDNTDAWHKKALALVKLGYQERLELKKPEDAEFTRRLAAAQGNMASLLELIHSKDDCWKEKSHRALRNRVKEAIACEEKVSALLNDTQRKDSYDELLYCAFETITSQPDTIAWPQTGDVMHLFDFKTVSNKLLLKILTEIIKVADSGTSVSIYQYILNEIKSNAKGLDIKMESKLLSFESQLVNQGDYSFLPHSDAYDENAVVSIEPVAVNLSSGASVAGYTKEQIDIAYYKKQIELKEEELELQRQQMMAQAKCPKCGSTSLAVDKKGFGYGKAVVGTVLIGPVGLLAGGIGANKQMCTCLNCKNTFKL